MLIDFWATWCGPCIASMPALDKLQREAGPKGLTVLSVDGEDDAKAASDFLTKNHHTWTNFHDENGEVGDAFRRVGIPHSVLIDEKGNVTYAGPGSNEDVLRDAIAKLGPQYAGLRQTRKTLPCQTTQTLQQPAIKEAETP